MQIVVHRVCRHQKVQRVPYQTARCEFRPGDNHVNSSTRVCLDSGEHGVQLVKVVASSPDAEDNAKIDTPQDKQYMLRKEFL